MSLRHTLAGVSGAVFVSGILILSTPVSGADYTAAGTGSIEISFSIPDVPEQEPQPEPEPDLTPQPEQPFDWNWTYSAPTCDGVTVSFPSNLPASQQGVMEVGVVGGSTTGMLYKLEGSAYQQAYPNGHAGQTVFIAWSEFRNSTIPSEGVWTVERLKVHGTNYHWEGHLVCGSVAEPPVAVVSVPASEPEVIPEPALDVPPAPVPAAPPIPTPAPVPEPMPEEVVQPPVTSSEPPVEVAEEVPAPEQPSQEGVTEE